MCMCARKEFLPVDRRVDCEDNGKECYPGDHRNQLVSPDILDKPRSPQGDAPEDEGWDQIDKPPEYLCILVWRCLLEGLQDEPGDCRLHLTIYNDVERKKRTDEHTVESQAPAPTAVIDVLANSIHTRGTTIWACGVSAGHGGGQACPANVVAGRSAEVKGKRDFEPEITRGKEKETGKRQPI
jgi:hypothetical protein